MSKYASAEMETKHISKRVEETRKEIQILEKELQKLISSGINKPLVVVNNLNTHNVGQDVPASVKNSLVHKYPVKENSKPIELIKNKIASSQPINKRQELPTFSKKNEELSPKKGRHYDRNEAREYMKRQKEKRLQQLKVQQENRIQAELKKQKLKELDQKTMQLLAKNLKHKRERSRSRENVNKQNAQNLQTNETNHLATVKRTDTDAQTRANAEDNVKPVPDIILNAANTSGLENVNKKLVERKTNDNIDSDVLFQSLRNITYRSKIDAALPSAPEIPTVKVANKQNKYSIEQEKSAIKIQACYRGYFQRKTYQKLRKERKKLEENVQKQTPQRRKEIPPWLQEAPAQAYPYNFISSVKRKLNFAMNANKSSTDVGVQSSLQESARSESPKRNIKSRQEIKELLEESLKAMKKSGEAKSLASQNINGRSLEPFLSGNPLEKAKSLNILQRKNSKQTHSNITSSRPKYTETSDSDTSKDIPELSSESASRRTNKNSDGTYETDYPTDSDSNCRPEIDANRLKHLKLQQRNHIFSENAALSQRSNPPSTLTSLKNTDRSRTTSKPSNTANDISEHLTDFVSEVRPNVQSKSTPKETNQEVATNSKLSRINEEGVGNIQKLNSLISQSDNNLVETSNRSSSYNKSNRSKSYSKLLLDDDIPVDLSRRHSIISSGKSDNCKNYQPYFSRHSNSPNLLSPVIMLDISKTQMIVSDDVNPPQHEDEKHAVAKSIEEDELPAPSANSETEKHVESKSNTETFHSLPTGSTVQSSIQTKQSEGQYSNNFNSASSTTYSSLPSLKRPSITLKTQENRQSSDNTPGVQTLSLKPGEKTTIETKGNPNQIHLKFEAELHLLNDFNESLRQFMAVEKSLLDLQSKRLNDSNFNTSMHLHKDTQTSACVRDSSESKSVESQSIPEKVSSEKRPSINYSRGSEILENMSILNENTSVAEQTDKELASVAFEISELQESTEDQTIVESVNDVSSFKENLNGNMYVGLSLGMFEQLIKDEDARIENLKTILSIREKALLDRTKGELAWLEIQKKHLRETGQLHEISLVKKKQRGILIKLQHEKHEMQRLKQMQKAASKERKAILKEQRNIIKTQLSNNNNMLTKIKKGTTRERRLSGPLKVYNVHSHTETVRSETSISRKSSIVEEVVNVTSHTHSVVSRISEDVGTEQEENRQKSNITALSNQISKTEQAKRTLLMREAALEKRRKTAEELLQWHQRLLEEERKIAELEMAASSVISQVPTLNMEVEACADKIHKFRGEQLNLLWLNMTGREEKKFNDKETYTLNQLALEQFCKEAVSERRTSNKSDRIQNASYDNLNTDINSVSESILLKVQSEEVSKPARTDNHVNSQVSPLNTISDVTADYSNDSKNKKSATEHSSNSINSIKSASNHYASEPIVFEEVQKSKSDQINSTDTCNKITHENRSTSIISKINEPPGLKVSKNSGEKSNKITSLESNISEHISDDATSKELNTLASSASKEKSISISTNKEQTEKKQTPSVHSEVVFKSLDVPSVNLTLPRSIKEQLSEKQITDVNQTSKLVKEDSDGATSVSEQLSTDEVVESDKTNISSINRKLGEKVAQSAGEIVESKEAPIPSENLESKSQHNTSISSKGSSIESELQVSINEDLEIKSKQSAKLQNEQESSTETSSNTNKEDVQLDLSYGILERNLRNSESETSIKTVPESQKSPKNSETSLKPSHASQDSTKSQPNESLQHKSEESLGLSKSVQEEITSLKLSPTGKGQEHQLESLSSKLNHVEAESPPSVSERSSNKKSKLDSVRTDKDLEIEQIPKTSSASVDGSKEKVVSLKHVENNAETIAASLHSEIAEVKSEMRADSNKDTISEVSESLKSNQSSIAQEKVTAQITSSEISTSNNTLDVNSSHKKKDCNSESLLHESTGVLMDEDGSSQGSTNNSAHIDVKKRVSEILADTHNNSRGDKSPRLQDLYVTTYDVMSPENSPESGSPIEFNDKNILSAKFGDEAEELFKKQLAIEQEIKQLEQQQKEQIPYMYMREIPNKPPPPYTPPASQQVPVTPTVLPTGPDQVDIVVKNVIGILYSAHLNDTLHNVTISEDTIKFLINGHNIEKGCFQLLFNLCKEIAIDHYKHFEKQKGPAWMKVNKNNRLSIQKPADKVALEKLLKVKVKQLFEFEKVNKKENMIIKWSRKKRDHVDKLLVLESQAEESEWTNYDYDELIVMNEVTNDVMNMLISESASVINDTLKKKGYFC